MKDTKEIKAFRTIAEGKWEGENKAAFAMVGKAIANNTVDSELYCEGDFDIMMSVIYDEISELIVRYSKNVEEMRHVSMGLNRLLTRLCYEKWAVKTGEDAPFVTLDGGLQ